MHRPYANQAAAGDDAGTAGLTGTRNRGMALEADTAERKVRFGYDPYETTVTATHHPDSTKPHVDLRQLSEQIRRQRQGARQPAAMPGQPVEAAPPAETLPAGPDIWPDRR